MFEICSGISLSRLRRRTSFIRGGNITGEEGEMGSAGAELGEKEKKDEGDISQGKAARRPPTSLP